MPYFGGLVKDPRVASTTGWVFGTFVYGGGPGGSVGSGWANVAPVGEMWGNDPDYPGSGPLAETSLNPAVRMPHVGYQGRLNGPVDNKASSCLSCHSTAEVPAGVMVPPTGTDPSSWFRNVPSGVPFDSGRQSTDYSLQLSVGIANFLAQRAIANARTRRTVRRLFASCCNSMLVRHEMEGQYTDVSGWLTRGTSRDTTLPWHYRTLIGAWYESSTISTMPVAATSYFGTTLYRREEETAEDRVSC
jgi:hypothetical protein